MQIQNPLKFNSKSTLLLIHPFKSEYFHSLFLQSTKCAFACFSLFQFHFYIIFFRCIFFYFKLFYNVPAMTGNRCLWITRLFVTFRVFFYKHSGSVSSLLSRTIIFRIVNFLSDLTRWFVDTGVYIYESSGTRPPDANATTRRNVASRLTMQ